MISISPFYTFSLVIYDLIFVSHLETIKIITCLSKSVNPYFQAFINYFHYECQFDHLFLGSINGQISAQPTNEVAYVKFGLDTEAILTPEEKELLPLFTHFFLSMGAGAKSYRDMDTAMELHTGSMGASIHM